MLLKYFIGAAMTVLCQTRATKITMASILLGVTATGIYNKLHAAMAISALTVGFFASERKLLKAHLTFGNNMEGSPQFAEWQERYFTVATEVKQKINTALGNYLVEFHGAKVHFIGSCAVRGLCGKEMLDFAIVTKGFLPNVPDTAIAYLEKEGWIYCGTSPHAVMENLTASRGGKYVDQWFMRKKTEEHPAMTLHCMSEEEAETTLPNFFAMRDYLAHSADARKQYGDSKRQGKDLNLAKYSAQKAEVASKIAMEAQAWYAEQQGK